MSGGLITVTGRRDRRRSGDRGAVVVEFALLVPLLLLLVFGIIDFGYMLNRDTMVNNVSRDAARQGSFGASYAQIRNTVTTELSDYGIPTTSPTTTITIDCLKADGTACNATSTSYDSLAVSGGTVIVRISYTHRWLTPLTDSLFGNPVLTKQTKMRIE